MKRFVATLAVAGIALSACGSGDAATVNGEDITLDDVAAVQKELNGTQLQANADEVLSDLIRFKSLEPVAQERGMLMSANDFATIQKNLEIGPEGFSESTKDYLELYILETKASMSMLTPEDIQAVNEAIVSADVSVSPRFGTWDSSTASLNAAHPDYLGGE